MRCKHLPQPSAAKTIEPEATVADVIVSLADAQGAALPVVDKGGRLLGFISESEIVEAKIESEDEETFMQWIEDTLVHDVMAPRNLTVPADAQVRTAAQQMLDVDAGQLYVTSGVQLIGTISMRDIVSAVATGKV